MGWDQSLADEDIRLAVDHSRHPGIPGRRVRVGDAAEHPHHCPLHHPAGDQPPGVLGVPDQGGGH